MSSKIKMFFLKRSIKRHGILAPVLVSYDGVILDGNHRVSIAKELGIEVPIALVSCEDRVVVASDVEKHHEAYLNEYRNI